MLNILSRQASLVAALRPAIENLVVKASQDPESISDNAQSSDDKVLRVLAHLLKVRFEKFYTKKI